MSRYFVTGATGFIGGRLARELLAAGHDVVALVRSPAAAPAAALAQAGVELATGDVADAGSMREPMTGVDGVFHVAGWYKLGASDSSPGERVNILGTRNVCELMADLGVPKGVYTSTLGVFSDTHGRLVDEAYRYAGPWLSQYERTKWVAHFEVAQPWIERGLPLVIVLPGLTYGPGDTSEVHNSFQAYLRRRLGATPGRTAYCWAHVGDTAHAHVLAMERATAGESYIIAGPVHTYVEAFAMAERITGIRAPRLHPAPGMMRATASAMGLLERVAPVPSLYRSETLRSSAGVTYTGDNAKARRELGYAPRPLEVGLRETLEWEQAALRSARA